VYTVPAQETAKHRARFAWPPERCDCSNEVKTRNPLKFAGVPQTCQLISAVSGPKFTILWDIWSRYCCLTSIFLIVDTSLSCKDRAQQICALVSRWRFLRNFLYPVFPASCMQHISDMHSKFVLTPHRVSKYGRHPVCNR